MEQYGLAADPGTGVRTTGVVEVIPAPPVYLFRVYAWDKVSGELFIPGKAADGTDISEIFTSTNTKAVMFDVMRNLPEAATHDRCRDLGISIESPQETPHPFR